MNIARQLVQERSGRGVETHKEVEDLVSSREFSAHRRNDQMVYLRSQVPQTKILPSLVLIGSDGNLLCKLQYNLDITMRSVTPKYIVSPRLSLCPRFLGSMVRIFN